jgi:hypothetical protein
MNKPAFAVGIVLIIIALILGGIQLSMHTFAIYGSSTTKYAYYGLVGIIGLIGIIIVAWAYMKKTTATETKPTATPTQPPT